MRRILFLAAIALFINSCANNKDLDSKKELEELLPPGMCAQIYQPVCAEVTLECKKEPCKKVKKTFSNLCEMHNNKNAKFLYEGECK